MAGSVQGGQDQTQSGPAPAPSIEIEVFPATPTEVGGTPPDRQVWSPAARLLVAAAVLVLGLGAVAVVVILSDPHRLGRVFSGGTDSVASATAAPDDASGLGGAARAARESPEEVRTAPLHDRRRASFELVDGLDRVDLRVTELGEELYRVVSPAASGSRARPELVGDRVSLRMERTGEQPGMVEVLLNARVSWDLRLTGGTAERRMDLSAARLSGLELVGGATRTDLRLPHVDGLLVVRVTGGVNQFDVTVTDGVPVRVRTGSGAGAVELYGERRDGLAPGTVLGSQGWDRAPERIFLDLVAGANVVTVRGG
ncbi:hypothetical protein [Verrucosispora sp. WMMD1129]|uniref:hypothetical protein n=1 Tax=Verrucosispora sp. WMMD1129 TaxID=3016093 RepID=UPI00249CD17E|nr:hypothetical protein [Verrucosispora sp. WMMD1129]WFE43371.1 hypothetical protein O7624_03080 [Verrucosispora sp. WMMD1129]